MNKITIGTIECEEGTMAGDIYAVLIESIPAASEQPELDGLMKNIGYSVAKGVVDNIVNSIDDGDLLRINDGEIVGVSIQELHGLLKEFDD